MSAKNLLVAFLCNLFLARCLEVVSPDSIVGVYYHIAARFGPSVTGAFRAKTQHHLVAATPDLAACSALSSADIEGKIVLILRGPSFINGTAAESDGHCTFITKVMAAQNGNATAVVIGNNVGSHEIPTMFDGNDDVRPLIPALSVSHNTFYALYEQLQRGHAVTVRMNDKGMIDDEAFSGTLERWITGIISAMMLLASLSLIVTAIISCRIFSRRVQELLAERARRWRFSDVPSIRYSSQLLIENKMVSEIGDDTASRSPRSDDICINIESEERSDSVDGERMELMKSNAISDGLGYCLHNDSCYICLEDFVEGEEVKLLRCKHGFHDQCIRTWIIQNGKCPICKRDAFERDW